MFDQMQGLPLIPAASLLPDHVHLGHTLITNDHQEFVDAIGYGIESYCELHLEQTQMSAHQFFQEVQELVKPEDDPLTDEPFPDTWRLGFLVGRIAGLLHPDVANACYDQLTYLEALSWKCKTFHQCDCHGDRAPDEVYYVVPPSQASGSKDL